MQEAYIDGIELAFEKTSLPLTIFPSPCPYSFEQIMDKSFYPQ
jgi:hypothetical protein